MKKIAVFASGTGTNFKNLILDKTIEADFCLLVCDKEKAKAIEIANDNGIETFVFNPKEFDTRSDYEKVIANILEEKEIDLIVLAGYMRILTEKFVRRFEGKIINIHPSYLPHYKGAKAIKDAYEDGKNIFGVTVHYVNEKVDDGEIIIQEKLENTKECTLEQIEEMIHKLEYKLYPLAVKYIINKKGEN